MGGAGPYAYFWLYTSEKHRAFHLFESDGVDQKYRFSYTIRTASHVHITMVFFAKDHVSAVNRHYCSLLHKRLPSYLIYNLHWDDNRTIFCYIPMQRKVQTLLQINPTVRYSRQFLFRVSRALLSSFPGFTLCSSYLAVLSPSLMVLFVKLMNEKKFQQI